MAMARTATSAPCAATDMTTPPGVNEDPAMTELHKMGLSFRACDALYRDGIRTAGGLALLTERDFRRIPGCGQVALTEAKAALERLGLRFEDSEFSHRARLVHIKALLAEATRLVADIEARR